MALWHGVLLMVLRAAAASVAENLQRFAQRRRPPRRALNAAGVLLQVASAPMDAVAYSVAPQSMLAPIGVVGMIFNLSMAQRMHGDKSSHRDVLAVLLVVVGAASCMLFGAASDDPSRKTPASEAFAAYAAYATAACAPLFGVLVALREAGGPVDALANAMLGGILGSTTVVASKVIGAAVSAPDAGLFSVFRSCLPIAVLAPTHLYVLNRSYGRHSLVFISPVGGAAGLLANVATGRFLYGELPADSLRFGGGVALLCCGVALLCLQRGGGGKGDGKRAV